MENRNLNRTNPMNPTDFSNLDSRLSYRCVSGQTATMTFRGLKDGTWRVATEHRETTQLLNAAAVRRLLEHWAANLGTVIVFACCCPKCNPPEVQELHQRVGRVSHGYFPECFAEAKAAIMADIQRDFRGHGASIGLAA